MTSTNYPTVEFDMVQASRVRLLIRVFPSTEQLLLEELTGVIRRSFFTKIPLRTVIGRGMLDSSATNLKSPRQP